MTSLKVGSYGRGAWGDEGSWRFDNLGRLGFNLEFGTGGLGYPVVVDRTLCVTNEVPFMTGLDFFGGITLR